ncbi:MAG: rhamnan synthesis F family protein [Lachnospiraceae bacterium]|nr:rhamnan synthesis F family protein [Lachnospiraceae bacterium]
MIYNKDGKIEEYVEYLLKSLKDFLSYLIVVVNGYLRDEELGKLQLSSDEIYIRENVGYDGGAYKEVLLKLFSTGGLTGFDELVLCNDSFYGPVVPWEFIFDKMEQERVSFWGLSKWLEGASCMPGYPYLPEHVQAYFLVIKSHMFQSQYFIQFWMEMEMPCSYDEAIRNFEIAFTTYFRSCGFQYKTWLDISEGNHYLERGQVVYCSHMADLIENCHFPVIKKKAITFLAFEQYFRVLQYIRAQGIYKSEFLEKGWKQYEKNGFPYDNIEEFYNQHERIYVFGYGNWGKVLECYFRYKGWKAEGFVVSEKNKADGSLLCLRDLDLDDKTGVIVALGEQNGKEVLPTLSEKVKKRHLLIPTSLSAFYK